MIIHSVRLVNIRSFLDETVNFQEGTTLLSGDIGSGKTTVLLAIEFAIFGVMKGVISSSSLLRNGATNGYVELRFSVENQQVTVKRSLKRANAGITQEAGVLLINEHKFEGSPQELKSKMLDILGYPESLLTKSKSLIFRYTVFTAQEEMKKILYESKEERLDVLRRLFNLDKYKRVKENTLNYTRDLRSQVNFIEGKLDSLPNKKKELESYQASVAELLNEIKTFESELATAKAAFEQNESVVRQLEAELEAAAKLDKELDIKKSEFLNLNRHFEKNKAEMDKLAADINTAISSLDGFDASKEQEIKEKVNSKTVELKSYQEKFNQIISKRAQNQAKKSASEAVLNKLSNLDSQCPLCLQKVNHTHVEDVRIRENQIILACNSNLAKLEQFEVQFKERRKALELELENYAKGEREFAVKRARFDILDEKKKRKHALEIELKDLLAAMQDIKARIGAISNEALSFTSKKEALQHEKKLVEEKREKKTKLTQLVAQRKAKMETLNVISAQLETEIKCLTLEEARLHKLKARKSWLEEDFVNLTDLIEKSVLSRIHSEFNSFFQEWFSTLLEDEAISVRLDDSFSALIEQNGYETTIENLSGGEKTSVALSYRLALNKVINDFMTSIRTRDLIILDEPTEGFSSEQLDRVREILRQTKVRQIIIVSHEAKMEGFVDSVLRVQKQNHISTVS